ncbi:MAG: DUF4276 family protein [Ruminococcaceae bacterium]|nr:DUF4276 family protein [Oscillospiraceae bacterium]
MSNKVIALFAEGPTEVEFYKAVVIEARKLMGIPYSCEIEYVDMKGIGNYKKDALRKFNKLKQNHPNEEIFVFLCIDHDVFEFSKKPPFNKTELQKLLQDAGAKTVTYIVAKQSIEEWFLCDLDGVLSYLRLSKSTKRPKGNGQEALKKLFKMANKLYIKGSKTEGFIEKLNINKIIHSQCNVIKPICKSLNLDCKIICKKNIN